jgi:hypothetical protein
MFAQNCPVASRPHIPGYGISDANGGDGLLPWTWARDRLTGSRNYWIATVRADGQPHMMPVWGVWFRDCFYFTTGGDTRKAKNLLDDARCVVSTEDASEAAVVEGEASRVTDSGLLRALGKAYDDKYRWDIESDANDTWVIRPRVVFGLIEHVDQFGSSATRWTFLPAGLLPA